LGTTTELALPGPTAGPLGLCHSFLARKGCGLTLAGVLRFGQVRFSLAHLLLQSLNLSIAFGQVRFSLAHLLLHGLNLSIAFGQVRFSLAHLLLHGLNLSIAFGQVRLKRGNLRLETRYLGLQLTEALLLLRFYPGKGNFDHLP
jgi:hypothetical protein